MSVKIQYVAGGEALKNLENTGDPRYTERLHRARDHYEAACKFAKVQSMIFDIDELHQFGIHLKPTDDGGFDVYLLDEE